MCIVFLVLQIKCIDPWKCLFFHGSRVTGLNQETNILRHILRERRMGREDARNTGERDQALYLDDDLEKQIEIENLEVSLWE